ncbi:uncharacterized protein LOC111711100 [Eurytemora carolleeae]|uniref:uncharacterized protein LOC111711100 n=1 Tax=Eurytemora carolleeae TaxID=1294199 RepID=UPI000C76DFF6|nr:uncharacterized protein LOC111711100 [Eurytemora carolleeae]|eukprot:XP_023341119.1 uncharacterized protein LOC111711100 [Eurytemora affinis]
MELVAKELADPERDCKRFDPGSMQIQREIVNGLIQVIRELVPRKLADPERDCKRLIQRKIVNSLIKAIRELVAKELADPERDCKRFDPGKRARELFNALDDDGNGFLTEDEFINGCMSDDAFVKVLDDFCGDFIWGAGK